jgi:SHS2 domain-containing protein
MQYWKLFSHDADMGVQGYGTTLPEAFAMAATALTAAVTDPVNVNPLISVSISCSAPDIELLFVDWLNAIIYEMDTRNSLFSVFDVQLSSDLKLNAIIKGEKLDPQKHHPAVYVKGATYTALKVCQENKLWVAQCVIDI